MIGYPQFWSKFYFSLPRERIKISALDTWLQRSASAPIGITIYDCRYSEQEPFVEIMQQYRPEMMGLLLRHLSRWRRLYITSAPSLSRILASVDFSSAYLLEEATIYPVTCTQEAFLDILHGLKEAPNLHSLQLELRQNLTLPTVLESLGCRLCKRLRKLVIFAGNQTVSGMLGVVHCCSSAEWLLVDLLESRGGGSHYRW